MFVLWQNQTVTQIESAPEIERKTALFESKVSINKMRRVFREIKQFKQVKLQHEQNICKELTHSLATNHYNK